MKYVAVPCDLWRDPEFESLSSSAKLVTLYAMSSPESNLIHMYRVTIDQIADECELGELDTGKAMDQAMRAGFFLYDFGPDPILWARPQMVRELGASLRPGDNRIKGIKKLIKEIPDGHLKTLFLLDYGTAYHLVDQAGMGTLDV